MGGAGLARKQRNPWKPCICVQGILAPSPTPLGLGLASPQISPGQTRFGNAPRSNADTSNSGGGSRSPTLPFGVPSKGQPGGAMVVHAASTRPRGLCPRRPDPVHRNVQRRPPHYRGDGDHVSHRGHDSDQATGHLSVPPPGSTKLLSCFLLNHFPRNPVANGSMVGWSAHSSPWGVPTFAWTRFATQPGVRRIPRAVAEIDSLRRRCGPHPLHGTQI